MNNGFTVYGLRFRVALRLAPSETTNIVAHFSPSSEHAPKKGLLFRACELVKTTAHRILESLI